MLKVFERCRPKRWEQNYAFVPPYPKWTDTLHNKIKGWAQRLIDKGIPTACTLKALVNQSQEMRPKHCKVLHILLPATPKNSTHVHKQLTSRHCGVSLNKQWEGVSNCWTGIWDGTVIVHSGM